MGIPFFSVADRHFENSISFDDFERSLYLNVLFQGGVVIPDIFIFMSHHLDKHINKFSRISFFESALENGLIIPAFRNPTRLDFPDVLFELEGAGRPGTAIQGVRDNAKETAFRLQLSANKGKSYTYKIWPGYSVGERFKEVILKHLSREVINLPTNARFNGNEIQELWKRTTTWRNDVILDAINSSNKIETSGPAPGLRRGEIFNSVARKLNIGIPQHYVNDMNELLLAFNGNGDDYILLKYFLLWVNECYHLNLAESLGSVPNSPKFIPPKGLMYESALPEDDKSEEEVEIKVIESIVEFPSLEILREIPGNDLVAIVNDVGRGYHAAIRNWETNPSSSNQQRVSDLIQQYAGELTKYINDKYVNLDKTYLDLSICKFSTRNRKVAERVIDIAQKSAALLFGSGSDILMSLAKSISVCYNLSNNKSTSEKVILSSNPRYPEVNFPK